MLHDIDLIPLAAEFSVAGHERAEADNLARLEGSGATRLVVHATILATGTISVFESLLQQSLGWKQPLVQLDKHLREQGLDDLAELFLDYRDANGSKTAIGIRSGNRDRCHSLR